MFTEINNDTSRKPIVTYSVMIISIFVTLYNLTTGKYEEFSINLPFLKHLIMPFQHGFNLTSSLLHFMFSLFFFWKIGEFIEKIINSRAFLIFLLVAYANYVACLYVFHIDGYGLTPITFSLVALSIGVLKESKLINMLVQYDSYYKFISAALVIFFLTAFLMFSFIPIFFDIKTTTLVKGVFEGNFLHLIGFILGMMVLVVIRPRVRINLIYFNRRKRFATRTSLKKFKRST